MFIKDLKDGIVDVELLIQVTMLLGSNQLIIGIAFHYLRVKTDSFLLSKLANQMGHIAVAVIY